MKLGTSPIILSFMQNLYIGELGLFLIVYMLPSSVRFTDTESLLKRSGFLKVEQVIHFFKFLDVKIETTYPLKYVFSKVSY